MACNKNFQKLEALTIKEAKETQMCHSCELCINKKPNEQCAVDAYLIEHASKKFNNAKKPKINNQEFGDCYSTSSKILNSFKIKDKYTEMKSSSSGIGFFLSYLGLKTGTIDQVICPEQDGNHPYFKYRSFKYNNLSARIKTSKYVMPKFEKKILSLLGGNSDKKLVFGLPCIIGALKKEMNEGQLKNTIFVSLICGHVKEEKYIWLLNYLGGEKEIIPSTVENINFRDYENSLNQHDYNYSARLKGKKISVKVTQHKLLKWKYQVYMSKRCNFCTDITGDEADISIGDNWKNKKSLTDDRSSLVLVKTKKGHRYISMIGMHELLKPEADEVIYNTLRSAWKHRILMYSARSMILNDRTKILFDMVKPTFAEFYEIKLRELISQIFSLKLNLRYKIILANAIVFIDRIRDVIIRKL